jgi:hypothetical protein
MAPKLVYIIRHCDKTDDKDDGCNDDGYNRAKMLVGFNGNCNWTNDNCNNQCAGGTFTGGLWAKELGNQKPIALLAPLSKNDKDDDRTEVGKCTSSNRCCLILNPTASYYGMQINKDSSGNNYKFFCDDDGEEMGQYILNNKDFDNQIVIVAWEHKNIPNLINALGVQPNLPKWPKNASDRFDLVFKVDLTNKKVSIFPQNLSPSLPNDAADNPFNLTQQALYSTNNNQQKISVFTVLLIISVLSMIFFFAYFIKTNKQWSFILFIISAIVSIVLTVLTYQHKENFDSNIKKLTFQEEAANIIGNTSFPNFYNCIVKDPKSCARTNQILSIRDNLDILNFAYFPLKDGVITYNKINPDSTLRQMKTNDPTIVILYYSAEIYTILGAVEDSESSNQPDPILEKYKDTLFSEVNKLFQNPNMTANVTWIDYFKYPGPYGTKWDTKTVDWTVDIKDIDSNFKGDLKTALYLNLLPNYPLVTSRQQNSQFWQDNVPRQNTLLISGLKDLISIQCDTVIQRYKKLIATDPKGDWDKSILKVGGENIDTYHRLRKSIRSMARAIENYPQLLDVFNKKVPNDFIKFINTFVQDNPIKITNTPLTYNDVILGTSQQYIIGYLFFVNDDNSDFFKLSKLSKKDYNSLRSLIYFKTLRVGYKSPTFLTDLQNGNPVTIPPLFKDTVFCPSVSRIPPMKSQLASLNNIPNSIYTYKSPSFKDNNFKGSYCELDNFMGDIHDYAVLYQKNLNNLEYGNVKDLEDYVKGGMLSIKNMFKDIDLIKVVNNLKNAL